MKNYFIKFLSLFICAFVYSQDADDKEWTSQIFIDLNATNKITYEYYNSDNRAQKTSINGEGSLELNYNIDYRIFNRLAVSGIAAITNYNNPSFATIKTGLGFKLLYVDYKYHYLTLQYGYHIPFSKSDFREGHQIKIGQVFDVADIFSKRLLVGFYFNSDYFYLENSEPLISSASRSFSLSASSFGISLGVKF